MATVIYNNLLNLILGTVMFLIIILYIGYLILKNVFIGSTAKNGFQIRIVQQKLHNIKENKALFLYALKGKYYHNIAYVGATLKNCTIGWSVFSNF